MPVGTHPWHNMGGCQRTTVVSPSIMWIIDTQLKVVRFALSTILQALTSKFLWAIFSPEPCVATLLDPAQISVKLFINTSILQVIILSSSTTLCNSITTLETLPMPACLPQLGLFSKAGTLYSSQSPLNTQGKRHLPYNIIKCKTINTNILISNFAKIWLVQGHSDFPYYISMTH